jgi:hypothetical protein
MRFKCGDLINLSVTVPEDGHLVVVHYCKQTGEMEFVFPEPDNRVTRVTRNQEIRIERQLLSTPGRYGFKVIFARRNLLPSPRETMRAEERAEQDLMALAERIEEFEREEWREVGYEYEVVLASKQKRQRWAWRLFLGLVALLLALIAFGYSRY